MQISLCEDIWYFDAGGSCTQTLRQAEAGLGWLPDLLVLLLVQL